MQVYIFHKALNMKEFLKKVFIALMEWMKTKINRYADVLLLSFAVTSIFMGPLRIGFPGMPMLLGSLVYYGVKGSKSGSGFDLCSFVAINVPSLYMSVLSWL